MLQLNELEALEKTLRLAVGELARDYDETYNRYLMKHGAGKVEHVAKAETIIATQDQWQAYRNGKAEWEMARERLRDAYAAEYLRETSTKTWADAVKDYPDGCEECERINRMRRGEDKRGEHSADGNRDA